MSEPFGVRVELLSTEYCAEAAFDQLRLELRATLTNVSDHTVRVLRGASVFDGYVGEFRHKGGPWLPIQTTGSAYQPSKPKEIAAAAYQTLQPGDSFEVTGFAGLAVLKTEAPDAIGLSPGTDAYLAFRVLVGGRKMTDAPTGQAHSITNGAFLTPKIAITVGQPRNLPACRPTDK